MKKTTTDTLAKALKKLEGYELQDVIEKVVSGNKDATDIIRNVLNNEYNNRNYEAKSKLNVGDKVWFQCTKRRMGYRKVYGKITEIRRKNIVMVEWDSEFKKQMTSYDGRPNRWRVSPTMLQKVA